MTDRDPVVRRAGLKPQQKRLLWMLGIGDVFLLGLLIFAFDDSGILEESWGWPLVGAAAVLAVVQFQFLRYIFSKAAAKQLTDAEK